MEGMLEGQRGWKVREKRRNRERKEDHKGGR